jgi:predicted metal-dependent RNase
MRQQCLWCSSSQNGFNVVINLCPAINVKYVAPLFEKRREQMVFVVLKQFVSEFTALSVCLVYFSGNLFTKNNIRKVFNQYLFMRFEKRVFIQCVHIDIVSHN